MLAAPSSPPPDLSVPRYRVLTVAAHPVQYASANLREMARHPRIDLKVAYCSLRGAEPALDPEFGTTVQWDVPLLDGYDWVRVPNQGTGGESFFGLWNPGLWKLIRSESWDALICLTSYQRASFWLCYFATRSKDIPFFFGTDSSSFDPREPRPWRRFVKRLLWPRLFRLASQVIVVSTPGREMIKALGIREERIALLHNTVDNDWWISASDAVDRAAVRASWQIENDAPVIVFCAKLQPWKRPLDLLRAFAKAGVPGAYLVIVIAGNGAQRAALERETRDLGLTERVRILGFVS